MNRTLDVDRLKRNTPFINYTRVRMQNTKLHARFSRLTKSFFSVQKPNINL